MRMMKVFTTLMLVIFSIRALAQEPVTNQGQTGEVTLEKTEDYSESYKNRRGKNGALFSVNMEKFYPSEYFSQFADAGIGDMIGEDRISLIGIELGYKRNFELGSIALLGNYGQGSASGAVNSIDRKLSFSKFGLSANYAMDNFLQEPYIVPYVQAGVHQFSVSEDDSTNSRSATAGIALNYKFGVLFQIDWIENAIDKTAKEERLRSSGLENVFIDVYLAQYMASSNAVTPESGEEGDPDLSSSGEIGVGLKLEF